MQLFGPVTTVDSFSSGTGSQVIYLLSTRYYWLSRNHVPSYPLPMKPACFAPNTGCTSHIHVTVTDVNKVVMHASHVPWQATTEV